jgi:BlaI family transcriptional regulator, penicillinase repressor
VPHPPRKPTDAELAILRVLWTRGPSTVRQVAAAMNREASYTTVLKLLQVMADKQLVRRDESDRSHVYEAAFTEHDTQHHLVADLVERAFGGSASRLVLHALSHAAASPEELEEIRRLVELHRQKGRP